MTKKLKSIYVAATSQHVGKTTSTLGLVSAFRNKGIDIGYCKPVGQRYVNHQNIRVDKDVILFADLMNFEIEPYTHSPVILGSGATADFIEKPHQFDYVNRIKTASAILKDRHELLICEGTGHPGVGSVVNISNAEAAKLTDSGVIMVAEGGIGSTIDMLNMCMGLFREKDVPILGVILNKVLPDKMEKVQHYVGQKLRQWDIPLLGTLPFDRTMSFPLMTTIKETVKGIVEYNEDRLNNRISDIIAGSLMSYEELSGKGKELLLVVSAMRLDIAVTEILSIARQHGVEDADSPFSGFIVTGPGVFNAATIDYVERHRIPVIRTMLDTYGAVLKTSRIEVKINQQTPWKVMRAIEMIEQNVNLDLILDRCDF